MEMTDLSTNVFYVQGRIKRIIVHKTLSQSCSANEYKPKQSIVNKNVSQNYFADVNKISSTEEEKPECNITEQKDADNEVTYDVP